MTSQAAHKDDGQALAQDSITLHSKSFALASRLLPKEVRDDAVVLYAYCRRADDAIDLAPLAEQPVALMTLREELDAIYAGDVFEDPLIAAFQRLVHARQLPRAYPEELIEGMAMDVQDAPYANVPALLLYCYRVASTVGLMMCHVMGVREDRALPHAAHLGIGMQLTNICRDVAEDWERGRLYLPDELLARHGGDNVRASLGGPFPPAARTAVAATISDLLDLAETYYASGDAGLRYLRPRCAVAVHAARLIYADIGRVVRLSACDPLAGRARVSGPRKAWLAARASGAQACSSLRHAPPDAVTAPTCVLPFTQLWKPEAC